jgi:hypothetical protein
MTWLLYFQGKMPCWRQGLGGPMPHLDAFEKRKSVCLCWELNDSSVIQAVALIPMMPSHLVCKCINCKFYILKAGFQCTPVNQTTMLQLMSSVNKHTLILTLHYHLAAGKVMTVYKTMPSWCTEWSGRHEDLSELRPNKITSEEAEHT